MSRGDLEALNFVRTLHLTSLPAKRSWPRSWSTSKSLKTNSVTNPNRKLKEERLCREFSISSGTLTKDHVNRGTIGPTRHGIRQKSESFSRSYTVGCWGNREVAKRLTLSGNGAPLSRPDLKPAIGWNCETQSCDAPSIFSSVSFTQSRWPEEESSSKVRTKL